MFKIKQTAHDGEDTGAGKPLMWKCSFFSDREGTWALLHGKQEMFSSCSLKPREEDQPA